MIAGIFHQGSGLGDQLFRYITVRTLAEENGFKWGMIGAKNFKGDSFMSLEMGEDPPQLGVSYYDPAPRVSNLSEELPEAPQVSFSIFNEKDVRDEFKNDIRSYDPEINFVEDNTIIDGSFEDDKYWGHNLANILKWLTVEPLTISDKIGVVGFRGGEYYGNPDLGLPQSYFNEGMTILGRKGIQHIQVHTDDPTLAKLFFPSSVEIIENQPLSHSKHSNMGFNWRSARYAKYAIIPNSAFFILPRLLKHFEDPTAVTIAPRYWARHNTKTWARPACYYKSFTYI